MTNQRKRTSPRGMHRVGHRERSRRHQVLRGSAAVAIAATVLLASCSVGNSANSEANSPTGGGAPAGSMGDPWETLRITGDEVEGYATLSDMAGSADAVVLGTINGVSLGRTIQGDAPEDQVFYAQLDIHVDETLTGTNLTDDTIPMELLVLAPTSDAALKVIADLSASTVGSEFLVFLRDKGGSESGLYRPVNSNGLWTGTSRGALDTPLAESTPESQGLYQDELNGSSQLQDLAALVRNG